MLYMHLPIFKDLYSLTQKLLLLTQKFHKGYRYTLGERINKTSIDLLTYIYHAQSDPNNKLKHITQMRVLHEQLTLLIRLSNDLQQIPKREYVELFPTLEAIGRQLTSRHQKISKSQN